jgi:hypothetical protein
MRFHAKQESTSKPFVGTSQNFPPDFCDGNLIRFICVQALRNQVSGNGTATATNVVAEMQEPREEILGRSEADEGIVDCVL